MIPLRFAAVAIVLLVAMSIVQLGLLLESGESNPLRYSNPQGVTNPQEFHPGDTVRAIVTKCNTGDKEVRITGVSFWVPIDSPSSQSVPGQQGSRILEPGCLVRMLNNTLPLELAPGQWRLEGQDCTPSGKCADWYTETIVVR